MKKIGIEIKRRDGATVQICEDVALQLVKSHPDAVLSAIAHGVSPPARLLDQLRKDVCRC